MKIPTEDPPHLGFQIAPMIDVIFVIMLFFMVMAGAVKTERQLLTTLPGTAETSDATDLPDEQIITIGADGQVSLNDDPVDSPTDPSLPQLSATLMRLKQNADSAKAQLLITIASDEDSKYSRTVDVLDACASANIANVTFTVSESQ